MTDINNSEIMLRGKAIGVVCDWEREHDLLIDLPAKYDLADRILEVVSCVEADNERLRGNYRAHRKVIEELESKMATAEENQEWVVHVVGPDDVIAQPNELTALRYANSTNATAERDRRSGGPNWPYIIAVVRKANDK